VPALYDKAFQHEHVLCDFSGHESVLRVREAGTLRLTSGELVLADALGPPTAPRHRWRVPAGAYPVLASLLCEGPARTPVRVACVRIDLSAAPPAGWRRCGTVGVDCGFIAFRDAAAPPLAEVYGDFCASEDGRAIAIASGWGDGRYACQVGRDAAGLVACVLVDFGLAMERRWQAFTVPLPLAGATIRHPLLERRGLQMLPMERWKSMPLERTRMLAVELRATELAALRELTLEVIAADGRHIAVERETLPDAGGEFTRDLVRLTAAEPLAGSQLRIALPASERRLR
jgi:hypothetical protein